MTEQVYFAYGFYRDSWKIKIGYSQNVPARMKSLKGAFSTDVELLAAVDGDVFDEAALHQVMHTSRYRWEWFFPNKRLHSIISYVKENGKLPAGIKELGQAIKLERETKKARLAALKAANDEAVIVSKCNTDWPYRSHEKIDRTDIKCIPLAARTKSELANIGKQ